MTTRPSRDGGLFLRTIPISSRRGDLSQDTLDLSPPEGTLDVVSRPVQCHTAAVALVANYDIARESKTHFRLIVNIFKITHHAVNNNSNNSGKRTNPKQDGENRSGDCPKGQNVFTSSLRRCLTPCLNTNETLKPRLPTEALAYVSTSQFFRSWWHDRHTQLLQGG